MADKTLTRAQLERIARVLNAILDRVLEDVPCYSGRIPGVWTDNFIASLQRRKVPDWLIPTLLAVAWAKGYVFTPTPTSNQLTMGDPMRPNVSVPDGTQGYNAVEPGALRPSKNTIAWLQARMDFEINSGNYANANGIWKNLKDMVKLALNLNQISPDDARSIWDGREIVNGAPVDPPESNVSRETPVGGPPSGGGPYR
jgi:hypothetical protein